MEGKKSFLLYCDMINLVEKLPDEKAGQLFKIIFKYVNDLNPSVDDLLLQIAFEPIKMQLKRDLDQWRQFIEKQSFNGTKGGRPKNPKNPSLLKKTHSNPKNPTTVTVNDTVNVNVTSKKAFIPPTLPDFISYFKENGFDSVLATRVWKGYDVAQWHKSNGEPIKNWKQTCQQVWFNYKHKNTDTKQSGPRTTVLNPLPNK